MASSACQLGGTWVFWWAAIKPPDSRALHVLSWDGQRTQESVSTLEEVDDPIFATLRPLFEDPNAQYIGAHARVPCYVALERVR